MPPSPNRDLIRDRFFFLHVPKTAGVSVHRILEQLAGPYLHLRHAHELCWPAAVVWPRFRGCGGHLYWAAAQQLGFLNAIKFTFLRDPVDRLLSQFEFSRSSGLENRPDALRSRQLDLKNLLRASSGTLGSFWNVQTLALSGLTSDEMRPEAHLESALSNLQCLDLIGLTETFHDDVVKLAYLLGASPPLAIPHENRTARQFTREALDNETLDLLEETQSMDRLLYSRAKHLKGIRPCDQLARKGPEPQGWPPARRLRGCGTARITRVALQATDGVPLYAGTRATLFIHWLCSEPIHDFVIGFRIKDVVGNYIAGSNSFVITRRDLHAPAGHGCAAYEFRLSMGPGRYLVDVELHHATATICALDSASVFEVKSPPSAYREGMVDIDATFSLSGDPISGPLPIDVARAISIRISGRVNVDMTLGAIEIPIQLINATEFALYKSDQNPLFVSYHWKASDGGITVFEGQRTAVPDALLPGQEASIALHVLPPPLTGRWLLQVRIVQDGVRWHEGEGFEGITPPDLPVDHFGHGKISVVDSPSPDAEAVSSRCLPTAHVATGFQ